MTWLRLLLLAAALGAVGSAAFGCGDDDYNGDAAISQFDLSVTQDFGTGTD
jgi:hypothetical protein